MLQCFTNKFVTHKWVHMLKYERGCPNKESFMQGNGTPLRMLSLYDN
jgi:hypothetical protein